MSSIQGSNSNSIKLGNTIVQKVQEKYPGSTLEELDLVGLDLPQLNPDVLRAFFTPDEKKTDEEKESVRNSNEAIEQLFSSGYHRHRCPVI